MRSYLEQFYLIVSLENSKKNYQENVCWIKIQSGMLSWEFLIIIRNNLKLCSNQYDNFYRSEMTSNPAP